LLALPFRERLAVADECVERAQLESDLVAEIAGRRARLEQRLEAGDLASLPADMDAMEACIGLGADPRTQFVVSSLQATLATVRGDFDAAEQWLREAGQVGRRFHIEAAPVFFSVQLADIRVAQGRVSEVRLPLERMLGRAERPLVSESAMLIRVLAEAGETGEARALLRELYPKLPSDPEEPSTRSCTAHLCRAVALLDDRERARDLFDRAVHFRGRVFIRTLWGAFGTAEFHLGLLARTLERYDEAIDFFEQANERNREMGALPWIAETDLAHAQTLSRRARARDLEEAYTLAGRALERSSELGQDLVARQAEELLDEISLA
jgi:tetratricopeptide (TPR) repeat protein